MRHAREFACMALGGLLSGLHAQAPAAGGGGGTGRADLVPPAEAEAEAIETIYRPEWVLPQTLFDAVGNRCLENRLRELMSHRRPAGEGPAWTRSFGDLIAAFQPLLSDREAVEAKLAELKRDHPTVWNATQDVLPGLVRRTGLFAGSWDPDVDAPDDGIVMGEPLDMSRLRGAPWRRHEGSRLLQQGIALVFADLEAIKAAENDYALQLEQRDTDYEYLHAVRGSRLVGTDGTGTKVEVLRVQFEVDLPFPFSSYVCDLRVRHHVDEDGILQTDIYCPPDADFHWMAGGDRYLPIRNADDEVVGMLLVRRFGFDITGVPDGDGERAGGLRAGLGRLIKRAEARYVEHARGGGEPRTVQGAIPEFPVTGGAAARGR